MKENQILVAVIAPQQPVRLARIENTLESLQEVVEGRIELFPVVRDTDAIVGICNEEGAFGLDRNRFNYATSCWLFGTFIVAGDREGDDGREFCSLKREQLLDISYTFGPIENAELMDQ